MFEAGAGLVALLEVILVATRDVVRTAEGREVRDLVTHTLELVVAQGLRNFEAARPRRLVVGLGGLAVLSARFSEHGDLRDTARAAKLKNASLSIVIIWPGEGCSPSPKSLSLKV